VREPREIGAAHPQALRAPASGLSRARSVSSRGRSPSGRRAQEPRNRGNPPTETPPGGSSRRITAWKAGARRVHVLDVHPPGPLGRPSLSRTLHPLRSMARPRTGSARTRPNRRERHGRSKKDFRRFFDAVRPPCPPLLPAHTPCTLFRQLCGLGPGPTGNRRRPFGPSSPSRPEEVRQGPAGGLGASESLEAAPATRRARA
jgi:hypothetical protein